MKRRLATLIIFAGLVPAGVSATEKPSRFLGFGPMGDFSAPIRSMQQMKFAGVVKQQYDFSCGSAALATLLGLYGDSHGESATFRGMWSDGDHAQIRKLGFSLLDMRRYLAARGRTANGYKVTLEQIGAAGVPGIVLVTVKNYRHFVVIQGIRNGEVLVGDPALGRRIETTAAFKQTWNGIFFAIDSDVPKGKASFNAAGNWAGYARAPIGSRFADPLSLQALSLTTPFYRDF